VAPSEQKVTDFLFASRRPERISVVKKSRFGTLPEVPSPTGVRLAISYRIHLVGRGGPTPGSSVPEDLVGECVVVETWPPHEIYVGPVAGTPPGLATASTAWLGIPVSLQRESARLDGRRIRVCLEDPTPSAEQRELEVVLIDGATERRLIQRRVACETWGEGAGEIECTLQRREPDPGSREDAPPERGEESPRTHPLGRLLHALPAIFRG
jgi:hypothetical protein